MSKHDDYELQAVSVARALPTPPTRKAPAALGRRPSPTAETALAALRATRGAAALLGRTPALAEIGAWSQSAFWSPCTISGAAYDEPFIWGCDYFGSYWNVASAADNCIVYFQGHEDVGGFRNPNTLDGRVWCHQLTDAAGTYVFVAHVQTWPFYDNEFVATAHFGINGQDIGLRGIAEGSSVYLPFVVNLPAGLNRFEINQHTGTLFFRDVTAYRISIPI
jgi:hypothetical protein